MYTIPSTDLILNADGSAYHLNLLPQDIADTIILVGDPDRVTEVSKHFDSIELRKGKREFITHTGYMAGKRMSVVSTGIGTDNIDIVLNELDALVNIDLKTRVVHQELKKLNLVRIGTSGIVQADIEVDSLLVSEAAIGLDALMHYYKHALTEEQEQMLSAFAYALPQEIVHRPYLSIADEYLLKTLGEGIQQSVTITAPGFYAPQGRQIRAQSTMPQLLDIIEKFKFKNKRITNLEMETAGIYGMATALGHRAISFNVLLANRITDKFSTQPAEIMDRYIVEVLSRVARL
ncbi:nucleoside phosphorylase [Mucilaginibacter agri]|uniref:Uridine phosphorylase n=1 Tax=Mucilaginibacter agri TaxID=2695265 RepID=A0A965ZKF0_9SPHI|nr:nucleoside phosphorylase [Mucilaginibacter agri]NCD71327.1 phosphorylase [Mucilaginibacter agri]